MLKLTYGSRAYPVRYTYDPQGRMATMTTWQDFQSVDGNGNVTGVNPATNRWNFHPQRGWLTSKDYPDPATGALPGTAGTTGPTYTYKPSGRLATRAWKRGITTTYGYNLVGELLTVSYSGGTVSTPSTTYGYDRLGRQASVVRNGITTARTQDRSGQPLTETYTGGTLGGLSMNWTYDSALRRDGVTAKKGANTLQGVDYDYDLAGRLWKAVGDGYSATYTYHANSALVDTLTFQDGVMPRLTTTRRYDLLNRLQSVSSKSAAALPVSFGYQHNGANQRERATLEDGSYWVYQYDALGQVQSGKKYWKDGSPVLGQQFEYAHDDIGNRDTTGGRASAVSDYSTNRLNQYTSRTVAGVVDVLGIANSTANVTVGIQGETAAAATRKGEYFHHALAVANGTNRYPTIEVKSLYGATQTELGKVFVPAATEAYGYDADGNLTSDGRWSYTWDGENRLVEMKRDVEAPTGAQQRLVFEYDWQGRRIRKQFYTYSSGWQEQSDTVFLYDGWNLVAELNANAALGVVRTYVWGNDLSGSPQGAGGVGGLLWMRPAGGVAQFVAYDGNGNVAALVSGADGSLTARYEYGPFGEAVRVSGNLGEANLFRFSTKYTDAETDLLYYGYRYYNPSTGRWLSRDPAESDNLYAFVGNDGISGYDVLGLWDSGVHKDRTIVWAMALKYPEDAATAIGNADAAVDGGRIGWGKGWAPWIGDQSYHFNRNMGGGDTRLQHNAEHMGEAQSACTASAGRDDPKEAARQLGTALHPLQDWVAHGDFFITWAGPVTAAHNMYSRQRGVNKVKVVDDVNYDAVLPDGSIAPDGRPAGMAMRYYHIPPPAIKRGEVPSGPGMLVDWAEFKHVGEANSLRVKKTKELTEGDLKSFQDYVRANGGCKCKKYFGVE